MNLSPSHQRNENLNLFGLLASRFLYNKGPHEQPPGRIMGIKEAGKERYDETINILKYSVSDYNSVYGANVEDKSNTNAHYESILTYTKVKNFEKTRVQIDNILIEIKKPGVTREVLKASDQYKMLQSIIKILNIIEELPKEDKDAEIFERRGILQGRFNRMTESKELKEKWRGTDAYKKLNETFESVASDKEFDGIWRSPNNLVTQNQRESQELFIAMMAEKTNHFTDNFVLGPTFQNNADENIRNFPFIYHEFLKHEGDTLVGDAVSVENIKTAEVAARNASLNLGRRSAQEIIIDSGSNIITPGELPAMPAMPADEKWNDRVRILNDMWYRLHAQAKKEGHPQSETWLEAADELALHLEHARVNLRLSKLKTSELGVKSKFTRSELSISQARQYLVMSLAMKKFVRAQEIVDYPKGNANWKYLLHPTVRRMLIASTYDSGVATYIENDDGSVDYTQKAEDQHAWMLSTLVMSDYFNSKEVGDEMDANHRALLKAAYLGGRMAVILDQTEEVRKLLVAWQKVLGKHDEIASYSTKKRKEFFLNTMGPYPPEYVEEYSRYNKDETKAVLETIDKDQKKLQEFLDETKAAIQAPYSPESKKFIAKMKKKVGDKAGYAGEYGPAVGRLGKIGIIDGATLAAYDAQMFALDQDFKTAELQDKNVLQFFKGLGMNIEGMYRPYLDMIDRDHTLNVDNWWRLLIGNKSEFNKLIHLLTIIIPPSKAGGKEDFLYGLISLRKKYNGTKTTMAQVLSNRQEGSEDAAIIDVFIALQAHLTTRDTTAAVSDRKAAQIDKKKRGAHIGDVLSEYGGKVFDLAFGPGQSMANRAAGFTALFIGWKAFGMAIKGNTPLAKILRTVGIAAVIEIITKETTGRGILDRIGLDSLALAMEGTYEEVLRQDAKENMNDKDITPEAHGAALSELNGVPFDKVIAWYESCGQNGEPIKKKGSKDLFDKMGIKLGPIKKKVTWVKEDKDLMAKHVLWETVRHFFKYVGTKDNKRSLTDGKNALKERWVDMLPIAKMKYSKYDHTNYFKEFGVNKSDITWQMVMRAEIDPSEVDFTKNKTPFGKLKTEVEEAYASVSEWAMDQVIRPATGHADEFVDNMGQRGKEARKLTSDIFDATKQKAYFGKKHVILWYKEHKYVIRRSADNHWDLLVTGLKMPFKVIYAVDDWAVPWTLKELKIVEESLRSDKLHEVTEDLNASHIASNPANINSHNPDMNPEFNTFGIEQESFMSAFENPDGSMSYENPDMHLGYYISVMTAQDANVHENDSVSNKHSKMVAAARNKARDHFRGFNIPYEQIDEYMYRIHTVSKTTDPETIYSFYRMPLEGSIELHLQEIGRFADFKNPNRRLGRDPFIVDPSQTSWENLQRGLLLDMDITRQIATGVGGYAAQVPRFVFAHMELAGRVVKSIGTKIGGGPDFEDAIDAISKRPQSTRMFIDEYFTSAKSEHMALSEFYKNPLNAKLYRFSLEYAQEEGRGRKLDLGLLEGRPNRDSTDYSGTIYPTGTIDYTDMERFYHDNYSKKPDRQILDAIIGKQ